LGLKKLKNKKPIKIKKKKKKNNSLSHSLPKPA